jgi:D-glycero-D-manno-heptose 1,7-bisphosphate phosphatase
VTPALVLLDRDGTLNAPATTRRYVDDPADVVLLPGAADAVQRLNAAGVPVVVVTNQRGVGTGAMTAERLDAVHQVLTARLAEAGARIDGWYVCPHDDGQCDCRKPLPGLLLRALADRPGVRAADCLVVGDQETDVAAGLAAGIPGVLLAAARPAATAAVNVQPSLAATVDWALRAGDDTVTAR